MKGLKKNAYSFLLWLGLSLFAFFFYHLLVLPAVLEFSLLGIIAVLSILFLLFFLLKTGERKPYVVFLLLLLLADKGIQNLTVWEGLPFALGLLFLLLFLFIIAKSYGKLPYPALAAMLVTLLIPLFLVNRADVPVLTHFTIAWKSEPIYLGKSIDYFPYLLRDINGDGKIEIVTLGNEKEIKAIDAEKKKSPPLKEEPAVEQKEEPLRLYAYAWQNGGVKEGSVPSDAADGLMRELTADYPGFPYYTVENGRLLPAIQRKSLAEGMMQFGTVPFRALELDLSSLTHQMSLQKGEYDSLSQPLNSAYHDLHLLPGMLKGMKGMTPFSYPTDATKIIGTLHVGEEEAILLQGKNLSLVMIEGNGEIRSFQKLTPEQIPDLPMAEVIIANVDGKPGEEVLLSFPTDSKTTAKILSPRPDGKWEILWNAKDTIFRFEGLWQRNGQEEMIALDKSRISAHPRRFMTGYRYQDHALVQDWRSFLSFINIRGADLDGDGKDELIAQVYQKHQIYVLKPHSIPVTAILIVITLLLTGWLYKRRFFRGKAA